VASNTELNARETMPWMVTLSSSSSSDSVWVPISAEAWSASRFLTFAGSPSIFLSTNAILAADKGGKEGLVERPRDAPDAPFAACLTIADCLERWRSASQDAS